MNIIAYNPNENNHPFMIMEAQLVVYGITKENLECILKALKNTNKEMFKKTNSIDNFYRKLDFLKKFYTYLKKKSKQKQKNEIINIVEQIFFEKKIFYNKKINTIEIFSL